MTTTHVTDALRLRFWAKVDKSGECWLWTGNRIRGTYGRFHVKGHQLYAHRVSWAIAFGPVPDGLWVLHRCDVMHCVRPDHLFLGTVRDNVKDMIEKGRENHARGAHNGRARLSERAVEEIRLSCDERGVLAKRYGVHPTTISKIRLGRRWRATA